MSLIGAVLAFFYLDGALRVAVIAFLLATDVAEIYIWLRWRKRRSTMGSDALVGKWGTVVTACDPEGRVKVHDQIWKARSEVPLAIGDPIVVTEVDGLWLDVARR